MSSATDLIIEQLREAEAIEQQSLGLLEGHLRGAPPGPYRSALRRHHGETRRHARQVAERLESLSAGRGVVESVIGLGEAVVGRVAGLALAPLQLVLSRSRPEALLRHARDDIAAEAREVALYAGLHHLAEIAGDTTTAALAEAIRADEQRQLETLRGLLEALADRVARERLGARPAPAPSTPPKAEPPSPPRPTNGGPVTTERETPYHDRAERLREERRRAGRTPEGPTRSQAARLREREREEVPVESEGAAAPGAEIHVEAPWPGYDEMKAADVVDRLRAADPGLKAMVRLYEETHKGRKSILSATAR